LCKKCLRQSCRRKQKKNREYRCTNTLDKLDYNKLIEDLEIKPETALKPIDEKLSFLLQHALGVCGTY
jgi:hypothetical protein